MLGRRILFLPSFHFHLFIFSFSFIYLSFFYIFCVIFCLFHFNWRYFDDGEDMRKDMKCTCREPPHRPSCCSRSSVRRERSSRPTPRLPSLPSMVVRNTSKVPLRSFFFLRLSNMSSILSSFSPLHSLSLFLLLSSFFAFCILLYSLIVCMYSASGKVIKGQERATAKSKYEEDVYIGNHTQVWGSYWENGNWGFGCCRQLSKNAYCTGAAGMLPFFLFFFTLFILFYLILFISLFLFFFILLFYLLFFMFVFLCTLYFVIYVLQDEQLEQIC